MDPLFIAVLVVVVVVVGWYAWRRWASGPAAAAGPDVVARQQGEAEAERVKMKAQIARSCPHCAEEVEPTVSVCPHCGTRIY